MNKLKNEKRWCVWKKESRKKQKSVIAYTENSRATSGDQEKWMTYDEANKVKDRKKFEGVGFYAADIDKGSTLCLCILFITLGKSDNPILVDTVKKMFSATYCEKTSDGDKYQFFFYVKKASLPLGKLAAQYRKRNEDDGLEFCIGSETNRFIPYSGDRLSDNDMVTDQTEAFLNFLNYSMKKVEKISLTQTYASYTDLASGDSIATESNMFERLDIIRKYSYYSYIFRKLYDEGDYKSVNIASWKEASIQLVLFLYMYLDGNKDLADLAYRGSKLYNRNWDLSENDVPRRVTIINEAEKRFKMNGLRLFKYADFVQPLDLSHPCAPDDILNKINEVITKNDRNTVTVLPFMCGLGKSTAISYKIKDMLENHRGEGMIVVTDSIARMNNYMLPSLDQTLHEYLENNKDRVCIMTSGNLSVAIDREQDCPILIMSTQRYFRLTKDEILKYTGKRGGGFSRDVVIFDERPYLLEQFSFDYRDLVRVDDVLLTKINIDVDHDERLWAYQQWHNLREKFVAEISEYVDEKNGLAEKYVYVSNDFFTEDDKRFWRYIERVRSNLVKEDVYECIRAVAHYSGNWGIKYKRSVDNHFDIQYHTMMDNAEKIRNINAKVIILDGTADISYEYRMDGIQVLNDDPMFKRSLDKLHIYVVDVPTSRQTVYNGNQKMIAKAIYDYLMTLRGNEKVVFTYKAKQKYSSSSAEIGVQLETELKNLFGEDKVEHFGNIRGKNNFNNSNCMAQYGLNQFSPVSYLLDYLLRTPSKRDELTKLESGQASDELMKIVRNYESKDNQVVLDIMNSEILCDIEQNLFRSAIRNAQNENNIYFFLFCSTEYHLALIDMILSRFRPLGASVICVPKPIEFTTLKTTVRNQATSVQYLREFIKKRKRGDRFTYDDIFNDCFVSKDEIKYARRKYPDIDKFFTDYCTQDQKRKGMPKVFTVIKRIHKTGV